MTLEQRKADVQKRMDTWKKCNDKYHAQISQSTEALTKQMRDLGMQESAIIKKFRDANPQLKAFTDSLRKLQQANSGKAKDTSKVSQQRKMIQDNPEIRKAMQAQNEQMRNDPDLKKIREQRMLLGKQIKDARLSIVKGDAECEECFKK
jgi:Xaa-Pro aminopeptidase